MVLNVADYGGGVIVQDTAPTGDASMLWINSSEGGTAYYYTGTQWKKVAPTIYISGDSATVIHKNESVEEGVVDENSK